MVLGHSKNSLHHLNSTNTTTCTNPSRYPLLSTRRSQPLSLLMLSALGSMHRSTGLWWTDGTTLPSQRSYMCLHHPAPNCELVQSSPLFLFSPLLRQCFSPLSSLSPSLSPSLPPTLPASLPPLPLYLPTSLPTTSLPPLPPSLRTTYLPPSLRTTYLPPSLPPYYLHSSPYLPTYCSPKKQNDPPLSQLPPPTKTSALKQAYQVYMHAYMHTHVHTWKTISARKIKKGIPPHQSTQHIRHIHTRAGHPALRTGNGGPCMNIVRCLGGFQLHVWCLIFH